MEVAASASQLLSVVPSRFGHRPRNYFSRRPYLYPSFASIHKIVRFSCIVAKAPGSEFIRTHARRDPTDLLDNEDVMSRAQAVAIRRDTRQKDSHDHILARGNRSSRVQCLMRGNILYNIYMYMCVCVCVCVIS
jgi:hypothetical protein